MAKENKKTEAIEEVSAPPTGFQVVAREFLKDRIALTSLIILTSILLVIFVGSFFIDEKAAMTVNIFNRFKAPSAQFWLGTDESGRDVFSQLILGARNSVLIGLAVTVLTVMIGTLVGIVSGYYGGRVDSIIMRVVDFIMILPTLMLIIVFVTIIPNYNMFHFVLIMSGFYWTSRARLIRTRTLSEASLDYVSASKTLGSSDLHIMFREVLPNLSSLIIVNFTLALAGNIGIETGLTYLGFGLPYSVPSMGVLIATARRADILESKQWLWMPAVLLLMVLMLCINYIGQAFQRAADAKQRLG